MATAGSGATAEVGTIKVVIGDARVIGVDGVARAACVGEKVHAREILETAANAVVQIQLADGRLLDMGRNSTLALDENLLGPARTGAAASPADDVAAVQAAIAAGADPSQVAAATAAGGTPGAGGDNEGHDSVIVMGQANSTGQVNSGVDTLPISQNNSEIITFNPLPQLPGITITVQQGAGTPGGVHDVFTYTLTDGDGDSAQATLDIAIGNAPATVQADPVQVAESGMPGGTDAASNSETVAGAITFDARDGLQSVTLGGMAITGAGQTIAGDHGTLTITGFVYDPVTGAGTVTYSYTLTSPTQGDAASETFTVVVTDGDGDQSSAPLTITVQDDAPVAVNDSNATTPGAPGTLDTAAGNVITAAGTSGLSGVDKPGADNAIVTAIASISAPGNVSTVNPQPGVIAIEGLYGTLTIEPNGDYLYVRHPGTPGGVVDVFRYTLTDGDGDVANANLTIEIGNVSTVLDVSNAQVSEAGLPARPGESAGSDAASDSETASGAMTFTAKDGLESFTVGGAVVTGVAGQTISGDHGTLTVTGFTYDALTGEGTLTYSYTLTDNTSGDATTDEFAVLVTDKDGDSSSGTLTVAITDDVPSISVTTAQPNALQVDETNLAANATASFAGRFSGVSGADGASIAYDLDVKSAGADNVPGTDSGLIDAASGKPIYLFENANGVIEGRVGDQTTGTADPNGAIAFTVSVNAATGEVTLDQILPIKHIVTSDPNDAAGFAANDLITLTATITDGDGDTASAQLQIGNAFSFKDDGPSVNVGAVDATGLTLITQDADTPGAAFDTASANFAAAFLNAVTPGYGADGAGSSTVSGYTLTVTSSDSGLTSGGLPITLTQLPNGDIAGSTSTGEVFRLSIDGAGNLTLTQSVQVDHTGTGNDVQIALANDKIALTATATVTDADGDSSSTPLTLDLGGGIRFDDAGPSAISDANTVEEGALLSVNAQNGVLANDAPGADGYTTGGGVVGVRAAGADTTTAVTTGTGGGIAGQYGTLILNADGSYSYQSNPNSVNANATDVFVYTIRDADGDQSTTTLTIHINNGVLTTTTDDVLVDEAALSSGSNPASTAETVTGTLADNVTGGTGGYTYELVGSATGNHGTLTLNANGSYSYTLTSPVTGANADNGANVENNRETFTYNVTDANGNTTTGNITVDIRDDRPVVVAGNASGAVEEEGLASGNKDGSDIAGINAATPLTATGSLAGLAAFGADGPAAGGGFALDASALSTLTAQNLTSNGVALSYAITGDTLTAKAGAADIFTLQVTGVGGYTFNLLGHLDHAAATGENTLNINFGGVVKVTDGDGDSVHLGGTSGANFAITVQDDIPVAVDITRSTSTDPALTVSGNLTDGSGAGFGADGGWVQVVTVNGATYVYDQKTDSTAGSTGANGTFNTASNQWTITTGNGGTLTVDMDDGAYTYAPPASAAYTTVENIGFTLTDNDGDTANANLRINVDGTALVVGQNVNDQPGQGTAHKVDGSPTTSGQISGGSSSDLLVGDVGGGTLVGKQTNVVLILDTSGSMGSSAFGGGGAAGSGAGTGPTRLQALKDGVNDIIDTLKVSGATDVRIHINHFSDTVAAGSAGAQTFDLVINGVVQASQVTAAHNFVNGFTATGFTNCEAGLQEALTWIGNGTADAVNNELVGPNVVNQAIFVSDGQPNRALTGDSTSLSNVVSYSDNATGWASAMNQVLGAGGGDSVNEVSQIESKFGQIQAIGIGLDSAAIARLSQIEGVGGSAVNTTSATQFKNELASLNPSNELTAVGNDLISGGAGNDVIFGDTVNTDVLGAAKGLGLPPGSGWDVFNKLETTPSANWSRADTLNYIRTHAEELAAESTGTGGIKRSGGADTLDGGSGNDTLYGQEGNDILIGGAGNDILSGGSGADTFKWSNADKGTPGAPAVDTIKDFNPTTAAADKDVLDLRDLLQGEVHGAGNSGNLSSYLSFEQTGNDVTLSVKSSGSGVADQVIVLQNVTMQQLGGSSATDSAGVIQSLLNSGKLISD